MNRIADAFIAACREELAAPKPGNVHVFADGHRMTVADFEASAAAAAPFIADPRLPAGGRIRQAVGATFAAVGSNTNLGIILLSAPLAMAAQQEGGSLRGNLGGVLDRLTASDTRDAYAAIAMASPAGLGRAEEHEVHAPVTARLGEVMAAAANRDRIAEAYVTGFAIVFETALPELEAAQAVEAPAWWPATAVYLALLSRFADSHIVRKWGAATAESVRLEAVAVAAGVAAEPAYGEKLARLLAFDAALKARNLNPGTSADFTVATLFAKRLSSVLPLGPDSG